MGLNYPKDQGTEWFNLKEQVKSAFTSANSRIPYQKIAAGVLKISTSLEVLAGAFIKFMWSNGNNGMFLGRFNIAGEPQEGFYVNALNGGFALSSYNRVSDGYGFTAVYDGSGNIVLSDDADAQKGVGRPWISHTFSNTGELTTPPAIRQATGTTDTTIYSTITSIQHPKMHYWGYVYIQTGGATAEVKFKNLTTGLDMHAQTSAGGWIMGDFSIGNWDFGDDHQIDITVRRASGTGNVGFTLGSVFGRQS